MFTILPGPAEHCQPGDHPNYNPPTTTWEVLTKSEVNYGCGDLIFSSHTTFSLTACLAITKYMHSKRATAVAWTVQTILVPLIIGSHKHYTVDLVVAIYTVPMVWKLLELTIEDSPPLMFFDPSAAAELRDDLRGQTQRSSTLPEAKEVAVDI
jgi:hypothetical protein